MKPTDFSVHVTGFLTHYLATQRNLSPNTIKAYRDVFTLLLRFCRDVRAVAVERLSLAQIDVPLVEAFLDHLAKDRHVSISTQNHRLAALHAFFRYVQSEVPERLLQSQQILAIPLRRHPRTSVGYLSKDYLAQILAQPDLRTRAGRRDAVMLSVLYDTGSRVQELIDLNASDVRLDAPAQVRLVGKGRKVRSVPLMQATIELLREHRREHALDRLNTLSSRCSRTDMAHACRARACATFYKSMYSPYGAIILTLRNQSALTACDTPKECICCRVTSRSRSSATF